MWFTIQQNFVYYILCFNFISNSSLSHVLCAKKKSPNLHQLSKLHFKSFPSKSNLKIKLIKCFNIVKLISPFHPVLLNLCHSPNNINYHDDFQDHLIPHQVKALEKPKFE